MIKIKLEISKFVGGKIKNIRKKRGLTQKELGERVGVKHNTISSYEKGTNEAEHEVLFKMANVLGVSINDFFPEPDEYISNYKKTNTSLDEYNYLPTAISAGLPLKVDGITEPEKISIPDGLMGRWAGNKDIFITKIFGNSMDKTMPDGSLIAVKPISSIDNLKNGDIVVFSDNYDYSIKKIFKLPEEIIFRPHSNDIRYTDYKSSYDNKDLKIHGKVVLYIVEMD